jgi:maltose alpha-D-glucosyltransferase/alpha-amylase
MLLSEANQWPEDVRPYLGDPSAPLETGGDEMQMNFHFPLMPRIYMALARADRTPIVEILARTPPIPDSCQWATFLRNHDELTLEMVTEEERQFMWSFYAPEPRMRLNLGIRRRLAPLLGNDRARIEVANSLLFTLPGAPVVYYGDELGMGDNIWLEDRDGVRTPMQWSAEPNAGFSTASAEELYAPVIENETYGHRRLNVEAQQADPGSLLNWMREAIRVRKAHAALARGEVRFLESANRAVLAYLRSDGEEVILVANNLSAEEQMIELDLADFASARPNDLLSGQQMAALTRAPFRLRLARYGYRWLQLGPATTT